MGAQRALTAIVFTDALGFSAMAARDESLAFRLIEADFALMRQLAALHQGQALKTTGDGMLLVFGSAVQAATWSMDFQTRMRERAKAEPGPFFEHRIGLHVGDVLLSEDDAQGDGVNVAARLQSGAPAGGVWVSATAYDLIKSRMEFNLISRGRQDFKNIPAPIEVYEIPADPSARADQIASTPKAKESRGSQNTLLAWLATAVVVLSLAVAAIALNRPANTVTKVVPGERVEVPPMKPLLDATFNELRSLAKEAEAKKGSAEPPTPPEPNANDSSEAEVAAALKAAETSIKATNDAATKLEGAPESVTSGKAMKALGEGMRDQFKDFENWDKDFVDGSESESKEPKGLQSLSIIRSVKGYAEKVAASKPTYDFQSIIDYISAQKNLPGNATVVAVEHWARLEKLKAWMLTKLARTNEQSALDLPRIGRGKPRTVYAEGMKLVFQTGDETVTKDLTELKPSEFAGIARILLKREPSQEHTAQLREFEREYDLTSSGPIRLRKN